MSGIFGFIKRNTKKENLPDIKAMLPWNRLYGGYGEGTVFRDNFSLGCCIQEINTSHRQKEPVLQKGSKYAVIDAVIYNRDELIKENSLSGDVSDPKLLFTLTQKHGFSCLKDVNGDFAGAVYDETTGHLTLFRDHMGIRPLFYYTDKDNILFSTDIRALLSMSEGRIRLSDDWIYRTVAGFDTDLLVNTPYESVYCVEPAHFIDMSFAQHSAKADKTRYFKLGSRKIKLSSFEEYTKALRQLVEDAVKRRLNAVSGVVGAELSGGLDSSVIDILINRSGREAIYFSWSLDPGELEMVENDERKIIEDICNSEKITCNYMHLGSDFTEDVEKSLKKVGITTPPEGSIDFRFALPPNSNTYTLLHGSFFVREKGATVMFTGHGGDEGISHRCNVYELFYHHEYYHYLKQIWSVTNRKYRALRTIKRALRNIYSSAMENGEGYTTWFASPELLLKEFSEKRRNTHRESMEFNYDPIAYIENGGSRNRLENMALLGAYSGIRYLAPYLDYRVIDFALSIPRHLYINGRQNRYIFREAFKDIMPKSLYELKAKEEASIKNLNPEDDWFIEYDRRKKEIIDHLDRSFWENYLDFDAIDELYEKGKPSDEEYVHELKQQKALLKCSLAQNLYRRQYLEPENTTNT